MPINHIKFFECILFSVMSSVIITCEDNEFIKTCLSFMIIRTTEQYSVCGHIEVSDQKMLIISSLIR